MERKHGIDRRSHTGVLASVCMSLDCNALNELCASMGFELARSVQHLAAQQAIQPHEMHYSDCVEQRLNVGAVIFAW